MTSLSRVFPLLDYWRQLSDGTRDGIISGIVVALVLGAATVFHKGLLSALRRLVGANTNPPVPQASPQELTFKFEGIQPASTTPPQASPAITAFPKLDLPRPPITGFVARRDSNGHDIVERLKDELAPEKNQLIVLWGAGGVGKTTLAAETARLLSGVFAGRIIWINAEGRPDFSLATLMDEIATYLGRVDLRQLVLDRKDVEVHEALASLSLVLIILDNFETILPVEQERCAEWLAKRANCPTLITSRDLVPQARPIHMLAMSLPESHAFLQRLIAQARNPRAFNRLDREQIIQAADRIPLVLQWAVKRIDSAKQPQTVLRELAQGEGDAAKRVFDRSFDLPQVGDDGRATLLALSLFVPSASRTALVTVAGFSPDAERLDHAVQALAELWLIETTERNERLSVEGLTRELAKTRLIKDSRVNELRRRFALYFLDYAQQHAKPTSEDYEALEMEKDNLLTAMDVAFDMQDWDTVKGFAYAFALPSSGMLTVHGYWEEAIRRNVQALKAARESSSESDVSNFAHNAAVLHQNRGEMEKARQLYDQSMQMEKQLDNKRGIAISLHELGRLAQNQGDLAEAGRLYSESLEINKKLGNQGGIAATLHELGRVAENQGKLEEARRHYNESLEIETRLGNQSGIARTTSELGIVHLLLGEREESKAKHEESLAIRRKIGDQLGIAIDSHQLGRLAEGEGNNAEAAQLFGEALAIFEKLKSPHAAIARRGLERLEGKSK